MSTEKPRQSTSLYSWDTSVDTISVKVTNTNNLTVTIGDISITMSPASSLTALDLAKAFSKVQVTEVVQKTIQV